MYKKYLCISTTQANASVALITKHSNGSNSSSKNFFTGDNNVCEDLSETVANCLDHEGNINLQDIDVIAIDKGPGSFNGIRAGIAYVTGISVFNKFQLAAVSSLKLLLYKGLSKNMHHKFKKIKVAIWARLDEFFCMDYSIADDHYWPEKAEKITTSEPDTLYISNSDHILQYCNSSQVLVCNFTAESFKELPDIDTFICNNRQVNANYIKNPYITKAKKVNIEPLTQYITTE